MDIWKTSFLRKICSDYFLGNFEKIWATFYSSIWSHCTDLKIEVNLNCFDCDPPTFARSRSSWESLRRRRPTRPPSGTSSPSPARLAARTSRRRRTCRRRRCQSCFFRLWAFEFRETSRRLRRHLIRSSSSLRRWHSIATFVRAVKRNRGLNKTLSRQRKKEIKFLPSRSFHMPNVVVSFTFEGINHDVLHGELYLFWRSAYT